jgi:aryl-phospho-beta-D-glucosidase BglC (GH1 family)
MKFNTVFLFFFLQFGGLVAGIIRGINVFGIETPRKDIDCTWKHPVEYYIDQLYNANFNYLRIPFSLEYVQEGNWDVMDNLLATISRYDGLNVSLDMHRVFASHQGETPFEGGTSLTEFTDGWITILNRYKHYPFLTHADVFNEYELLDTIFWNTVSSQIIYKIEEAIPERFKYFVGGTRWGGTLEGIDLEDIPFSDRIFYTLHKYSFSGVGTEEEWKTSLGSYPEKVSVGEWGFNSDVPEDVEWAKRFIAWLKKVGIRDTFFWVSVANSGDTGGLYETDCQTFDWYKYSIIQTLWEDDPAPATIGKRLRGN